MSLFRWTKPRPGTDGLPHGLNPDKLTTLENLSETPGYLTFMALLRDIAEDKGLHLLHYRDESDFRFWQGYVNALRDTQNLIPDLVDRHARQRTEPTGKRAGNGPDKRSFFGGPYWDELFGRTDTGSSG